jgi:hypothetical protein
MQNVIAVISADIVNSRKLGEEKLKIQLSTCMETIKRWKNAEPGQVELFRGDSFQVSFANASLSLKIAMDLIASVRSVSEKGIDRGKGRSARLGGDIRIGLGIGAELAQGNESFGQAFSRSGLSLDKAKIQNRRLVIDCGHPELDRIFDFSTRLLDPLINRWTSPAAEVFSLLLHEKKESRIAEILDLANSSVSQRKSVANWEAMQPFMRYFSDEISNRIE